MVSSRLIASPSNTLRRYFATKTTWTCILKTQCRPCLISLSSLIGHIIISACNASKPSNTNCDQTASKSGKYAVSLAPAGSFSTRRWRCRRSATSVGRRNWAMRACASCSPSGATAQKRHGWRMRPFTRCNRRSRIWSVLRVIFSPDGPTSLVSRRKASQTVSVTPTRNRSSSTKRTAACSCRSWAGCATATVARCWAQSEMSP
ncbi:Uncharacterised protein [Oligella urethralis]|uniref:Uncharacterized protein n=1 Tax=Oligella urethralis TaxID=90245 RepID=A0A2X1WL90_9BURK|nr:Uncharacterised protein [Oligella urethralis]